MGAPVQEFVQKYYGEVLEHTQDLKTNACCTVDDAPAFGTAAIAEIHEEVRVRYYGCGLLLPEALEGCRILDLGLRIHRRQAPPLRHLPRMRHHPSL